MILKEYFVDKGGFATFGVLGDFLIGLVGAFFGVFYGESVLTAIGASGSGFGALTLTAGLGAIIFLFVANLLRVVSGPCK